MILIVKAAYRMQCAICNGGKNGGPCGACRERGYGPKWDGRVVVMTPRFVDLIQTRTGKIHYAYGRDTVDGEHVHSMCNQKITGEPFYGVASSCTCLSCLAIETHGWFAAEMMWPHNVR